MNQLLLVNERYHELLAEHSQQSNELELRRREVERLQAELANSDTRFVSIDSEQASLLNALRETRAANELLENRLRATEDVNAQLSRQAQDATQRALQLQQDLGVVEERAAEAERLAVLQYRLSYDDATELLGRRQSSTLRRERERAQETTLQAFEFGRAQRASEESGALLREQAQRRLLLHRAEESRLERVALQRKLEHHQAISSAAIQSKSALSDRFRGVRNERESLAGALRATRAAHAQDLEHFQDMEAALDVACSKYAALSSSRSLVAQSHAPLQQQQQHPVPVAEVQRDNYPEMSPAATPPARASPPEAMRSRAPRPASFKAHGASSARS
jgi:chromosome segregation ATPase